MSDKIIEVIKEDKREHPAARIGEYLSQRLQEERESNPKFAERELFWSEFAIQNPDQVAAILTLYELTTNKDTLTGLLSRSGFIKETEDMRKIIGDLEISDEYSVILIYGDTDGLKKTNDTQTYGRDGGDRLLIKVSEAFQESVSVGVVGRVGPDEFGLVTIIKNKETIQKIADKIEKRLQGARDAGEIPPWGGVSLGVINIDASTPVDELLNKGDTIMKIAKNTKIAKAGERGGHVAGLQELN